jgi:GntR family transcriptional regulator
MAAQGRTGSWTAQSATTTASPAIAKRLGIEPGAEVMRTAYVMTADGEPAYLSTSWEPTAITGGTPVMLPEAGPYAGTGVQDRMAAIGHAPTRSTEDPAIYYLTTDDAARLGKRAGLPCLLIRRTYYEGDRPLETADIVLPPDIQASYEIPIGNG